MNVRDRTVGAVLALTAVSVVLRLVGLGTRIAHWDEGRVAYWILEYAETGVLSYRPIVHGPLLKLLNAPLFGLFGATDLTMRLVPALVGGLLPLVALAFRHRLRDAAVVALAAFLTLDPALLYYSRFMRNDILVAAFCFVAFAAVVRAIDVDDGRYLPVAALALALGFGAKENALAYVFAFAGAAGLLAGHRLVFAWYEGRTSGTGLGSAVATLRDLLRWGYAGARRHARAILGSVVAFVATVTYVYAPRGTIPSEGTYYSSCRGYDPVVGIEGAPTLGAAIANPLRLPRLGWYTVGSTAELYACQWITPRTDDPNPYLEYAGELAAIAGESSAALIGLAVVGFGVTLYRPGLPDDLVSFGFYWGAASLVGYPLITDIGGAAWLVVHVVLPLSLPAAFGAGALYGTGRDARIDGDTASAAVSVAVAALLVGSVLWGGYATSIAGPTDDDNPLVQYAQPSNDLRATLVETRELADRTDGTDVVLAGGNLTNPTSGGELDRRPNCADWFEITPLPWYLEAGGIEADCAPTERAVDRALADDPPVVVVTETQAGLVDDRIDDRYDRRTHRMRTTDTEYVYYVDDSQLSRPAETGAGRT
ncbi:TIGR03663 family protein [Natronomonas moolapensis 8.8.11]|uniref:TIGR03663 family protein n=1 Tax=Natronomonas moolapensis (strain DSM 18674 / CECT 7526 / JCM 14361 / 8.8.11) TaxID=268739 RepID=M1XK73_NATM8|nr:flippase activity-associated protein Agl23 [Natronomonas moolapensis]CCQ35382.1 TIGR03663 family protein [Natronomonas moolapensis 8.8.11]